MAKIIFKNNNSAYSKGTLGNGTLENHFVLLGEVINREICV